MNRKQLNRTIYAINVEDVQTVAQDELERELTDKEVKDLEETIANNIGWYDAIQNALMNKFGNEVDDTN